MTYCSLQIEIFDCKATTNICKKHVPRGNFLLLLDGGFEVHVRVHIIGVHVKYDFHMGCLRDEGLGRVDFATVETGIFAIRDVRVPGIAVHNLDVAYWPKEEC